MAKKRMTSTEALKRLGAMAKVIRKDCEDGFVTYLEVRPPDGKACTMGALALKENDALTARAEAAEDDWQSAERIVKLFRQAAHDLDGLSDAEFRFMVRILNFDPPTDADTKRTHKLAAKYGWEMST